MGIAVTPKHIFYGYGFENEISFASIALVFGKEAD